VSASRGSRHASRVTLMEYRRGRITQEYRRLVWFVEGVFQLRHVADERSEVLAGKTEHAGVAHGSHGGSAAAIPQEGELTEMVAGPKAADRLLGSIDAMDPVRFAVRNDLEAGA